jgi:hypothetical protein
VGIISSRRFTAAVRLPANRVVAEAASFNAQSELLGLLRNTGAEITLDTRIAELSEAGSYVPSAQWLTSVEERRVSRFLDVHLASADRRARQAAKLDTSNPTTKQALEKASLRLDRMRDVLENLDQTLGREHSRSLMLQQRSNRGRTGKWRQGS